MSLNSTGYAVLQWQPDQQKVRVVALGHIDNKKQGRIKWNHGKKLLHIFTELKDVLNKYPEISVVVREKGISRFNKATQVIFRVVGTVDLLLEILMMDSCNEIGITQAKKLITGDGRAEKTAIAAEVLQFLAEPVTFAVDDESDAVAVGVAYFLQQEEENE